MGIPVPSGMEWNGMTSLEFTRQLTLRQDGSAPECSSVAVSVVVAVHLLHCPELLDQQVQGDKPQ